MPIEGILYDGATAIRHDVVVDANGGSVDILFSNGGTETVDAGELKRLDSDGKTVRIGRPAVPGWRLLLSVADGGPVLDLLAKEQRYGRLIDRVGLVPAAIGFAALAAIVVTVGYAAPQWVAPHVPAAWERNLGTAIVGDFGDMRCRSPEGQRALEALVERLSPGALQGPDPIKVATLDIGMLNAAALPGGHIVIFKPAITETDPEQLAGLLAHEIAHVRRRHVTEALIRELGIGALVRLFAGNVGSNAEQLLSLSYTRENEAEADADAIAMLQRANISPRATAQLFQTLASENDEDSFYTSEFLSSHPLSSGRAKRFAAAHDPKATYRPALTRDETDALFNICWKGPVPPA